MDNTAKLRPFYIAKILHEKTDEEAGFRLTKDSPPQNQYQHHAPVKLCLYGCFAFIICRSPLTQKHLTKMVFVDTIEVSRYCRISRVIVTASNGGFKAEDSLIFTTTLIGTKQVITQ